MKSEFTLQALNWYSRPEKVDFEKAIKASSSKYDKIKEAISVLIDNYYKDHENYKLYESRRVSKIFLKNNLDNIKEILNDDTTIEDFISTLDISLKKLSFADDSEKEMVRDYVIKKVETILKKESKNLEKRPPLIAVSTLEENKEKIGKTFLGSTVSTINPHIGKINNSIKTNSLIISGITTNIGRLNLRLKGIATKLNLIKMKNIIVGGIKKTAAFVAAGGKAIWGAMKWVGTALVTGLIALGKGIAKVTGFIFKFVGKILVGLITGAIMLVTGVFGLFFKGIMLILKGVFFIFKLAINAVIFALGLLVKLTVFLAKGVFVLTTSILKGTAELIKKTMSLGKKIVIGIFKTLPFLLLTREGAYLLGMIAGFVYKYVVQPIIGTASKIYDFSMQLKDRITNLFGSDEKEDDLDLDTGENSTIFGLIKQKISSSKLFQDMCAKLNPILGKLNDVLKTVVEYIDIANEAVQHVWSTILSHAGTSIGVMAGGLLGKFIGSYWGKAGNILGTTIGILVGGTIGYMFEQSRKKKFDKVEDTYGKLEEIGLRKSSLISSGIHRSSGMAEITNRDIRKQNIITHAMKTGGNIPSMKSVQEIDTLFETIESMKKTTNLFESRSANEMMEDYHRRLTTTRTIRGQTIDLMSSKDLSKQIEEMKKHDITSSEIINKFKTGLVESFQDDDFIRSRIEQYSISKQDLTDEETANQIYTLYNFVNYLIAAQGLMSRFLIQQKEKISGDDYYDYIRSLLIFAYNNHLISSVDINRYHQFYAENIEGKELTDDISVVNFLRSKRQSRRFEMFNAYIKMLYENKLSNGIIENDLMLVLGPELFKNILTFQNLKTHGSKGSLNINGIIGAFNKFFEQNNITDYETRKFIVRQVLSDVLPSLANNNGGIFSAFSNGDDYFEKIIQEFTVDRVTASLSRLFSEKTLDRITKLNELKEIDLDNTSDAELRNLFVEKEKMRDDFLYLAMEKILEDSKVDSEEETKIRRLKQLFDSKTLDKILKKLLSKQELSAEEKEAENTIIAILNEETTTTEQPSVKYNSKNLLSNNE